MMNKLILLFAIIMLSVGVMAVFLSRGMVRKNDSVENENVVVRNVKIAGFIVIMAALVTIYLCI